MTLRLKLQLAAAAIAILSMAAMAWVGFETAEDALIDSLEVRVRSVAATVAVGIEPRSLDGLAEPGSERSPGYLALHAHVGRVCEANRVGLFPIRYVYLLVPTTHGATSGWDFILDGEPMGSPDWAPPGEPYSPDPIAPTLSPLLPTTPSSIYLEDRWGRWLSGYAPIFGAKGEVVALVGADIDYKVVTDVLLAGAASAVLVVALVSLGIYWIAGISIVSLLRPIDRMRHFISAVGAGDFGTRLPSPSGDELGAVAADLNTMAMKLSDRERLSRENATLSSDVARKEEQLVAIARVDVQLHEIQDLDILIDRILGVGRRLLRCDAGSVLLREGEELHLKWVQNDTLSRGLAPGQRFRVQFARIPVGGGSIAGYVAMSGQPALIDDAYAIPSDAPYHFNRAVDDSTGYRTRSVLAIPLQAAGKVIGVLQLLNPLEADGAPRTGFAPDDLEAIHHFASAATVALKQASTTRAMVMRMIEMAEMRDPSETASHVQRVAEYSIILYEAWAARHGVDDLRMESERDILKIAAMLHDVGKVGISDTILKKPGRLTVDEYRTIQQHAVTGARLFADRRSPLDRAAFDVALHHHERWDGAGYPGDVVVDPLLVANGTLPGAGPQMAGERIPLFARIVAVADVFDALSSKRQYKEAWPEDRVITEMTINAGRQFDPEFIELLTACLPAFRVVAAQYP